MDPFVALADPVRRLLLVRLTEGPQRVVDLAADHTISRPAISRHLRVLTQAGLCAAEEHGRERHYRLVAEGLYPVDRYLARVRGETGLVRFGDAALDGLDLEVRRTVRDHRGPVRHADPNSANKQEDTA